MKPRALDYILLVYVLALFASSLLAIGSTQKSVWFWIAGSFPSGFFLTAILLILSKNILKLPEFDFGLSKARWATIIGLLGCIFLHVVNLPTARNFIDLAALKQLAPAQDLLQPQSPSIKLSFQLSWESIPTLITLSSCLFAAAIMFLGFDIGPKWKKISAEPEE